MRNFLITPKRAPWERPFAVIKNIFNSGHQIVTTIHRTHTKKHIQLPQLQPATTHHTPKKKPPLTGTVSGYFTMDSALQELATQDPKLMEQLDVNQIISKLT
ncbi:MAG: hypothetical protein BME94_03915 [Methanobacteriales archaeon Met13]